MTWKMTQCLDIFASYVSLVNLDYSSETWGVLCSELVFSQKHHMEKELLQWFVPLYLDVILFYIGSGKWFYMNNWTRVILVRNLSSPLSHCNLCYIFEWFWFLPPLSIVADNFLWLTFFVSAFCNPASILSVQLELWIIWQGTILYSSTAGEGLRLTVSFENIFFYSIHLNYFFFPKILL